ncbi:MAG: glycosyltransferase family 39 protein [Candidatus Hydrogenedentes bacterium]|nr:glycosyltransferase family 39 protein [Candidatus Hydrogenedentota bacterium]
MARDAKSPFGTFRLLFTESVLVYGLFHVPMAVLLALGMWTSLSWMTICDGPIFMYSGFLMDRFGMVPVRDFFTYNLIGTHVMFRWLYHIFGGSVMGIRIADATVMLLTMILMVRMLAPFGRRAGLAAALMLGLLQYFYYEHASLEREYLAMVPIALAVLSTTIWFAGRPRLRMFMTGLFCGVLVTLKPHLAICGAALYGYLLFDRDASDEARSTKWFSRALHVALWCSLGGIIPILWMIAYCVYYGILGEYMRTMTVFFPLHADINLWNRVFEPGERWPYLIKMVLSWRPWGNFLLATGTIAGVSLLILSPTTTPKERRLGYLYLGLLGAYMLYPAFSLRFYDYHYYPFWLFSCVWMGLCLKKWPEATPLRYRVFSLVLAAYVVGGLFYTNVSEIKETPLELVNPAARTKRMTTWLAKRLKPGDTIQPIEWGFCGTIHAALETEAKVATRIVWGEGLFHHVSNPFVVDLRKGFVEELETAKPRFILRSEMDVEFIKGRDCSSNFPELDAFLRREYFLALESKDFSIWESNESPTAEEDRARRKVEIETQRSEGIGEENLPSIRIAR